MPSALVSALVKRTTWHLFCPACGRSAYPDVIALLERYGDAFTSDVLYRRARCRACGARLKMAGGAFVSWLQDSGALHRMVLPARTARPAF